MAAVGAPGPPWKKHMYSPNNPSESDMDMSVLRSHMQPFLCSSFLSYPPNHPSRTGTTDPTPPLSETPPMSSLARTLRSNKNVVPVLLRAAATPAVSSSRAAPLATWRLSAPPTLIPLRGLSTTWKPDDKAGAFGHKPAASATDKDADDDDEQMRDGTRSMVHFKLSPNRHPLNVAKLDPKEKVWENPTHHSVWTVEEVNDVRITHLRPTDVRTTNHCVDVWSL